MTHLSQYAAFLLATHTEDFTTENIKLLRENNVPLIALLQNLPEKELHAYIGQLVTNFLHNLTREDGLGAAIAVIQKWKANEIILKPRNGVSMEDFVVEYSIRKQVMIEMLPLFTLDLTINNAVVLELEQFFRILLKEALQIYADAQEQILLDRTKVLQEAGQQQSDINQVLTEQMARLKKNKAALKESQAMAHLGHWELDFLADNQVYWSDELYRIFGIDLTQKLSLDFIGNLIHREDFKVLQSKIQEAITQGTDYVHEYRINRRDGNTRFLITHGRPEMNIDGKIVKLKGTTQDITERKEIEKLLNQQRDELQTINEELQTTNEELQESQEELQATNEELREQIEQRISIEAALQESEKRFRLLANNSSDMISTHMPDGVFTYVSPSCKTLLGYTAEELIGRQVYELFHPEDIAAIQEKHNQSFEVPDIQITTYRIQTKSGEYTWFESTGVSIRDEITGQVTELHVASRDISLRKKTEENLEKERSYFKAVLENIADGIVACNEKGLLSFFNEATRNFHGLPEIAISPDQWASHYNLYYPDGKTILKTEDIPLFIAYRGEKVDNIEMIIAPSNGRRRIVVCNGREIITSEGKKIGAVVVMHDITQQKQAQKELMALNYQLQESNEELARTEESLKELNIELEEKVHLRTAELQASIGRFQLLADTVPQIIWTTDSKGNVDYFNQNWYTYSGFTEEESYHWGWEKALHPDDIANTASKWLYAVKTGEFFENEHRFRRAADGMYRWHLARGIVMRDEKGKLAKWLGSCTDIHDRKLVEEQIQEKNRTLELLNSVGITLSEELEVDKIVQAVTDITTKLTRAQFGAFFYNVIDEKGESFTLYAISGVPREKFENFPMPRNTAVFGPTFRNEGIVRSDDITQDARYGKNKPYQGMPEGHLPVRSYLAVPVVSRSGEVLGGLFFGHAQAGIFTEQAEDIVQGVASQAAIAIDNSRLFNTLKSKNRELQIINADLDNFMYTASHDLKAPITNLESLFTMLNKRLLDKINEPEQKLFDMVNYSIQKFNRTIRDLTEITAIHKDTEHASQVSFQEVYEDVKTDIVQMIAEAGGEIHADFQADSVHIEKKNLRSILYNLLTNAIKYRSSERILQIQVTTLEQENFIVLKVTDNGLGLSASQQAKLFVIFKRHHTHVEGSGIGLYILKRIVENKGGHIEVSSEEGKGTTFSVFLNK